MYMYIVLGLCRWHVTEARCTCHSIKTFCTGILQWLLLQGLLPRTKMAGVLSFVYNVSSILVGVAVFLGLAVVLRYRRNLPPGPRGWPILGLLPKLLRLGHGYEFRSWLSDLSRRHDIYSLNIGGQLVVVVSQYTTIKVAFINPQAAARPPSTLSADLKIFPNPHASGIVMSSGEKWSELRMYVMAALRGDRIGGKTFEDIVTSEAKHLVQQIRNLNGRAFDPKSLLRRTTANVMSTIALGRRFDDSDPRFQKFLDCLHLFSDTDGFGSLLGMVPFIQRLGSLIGFQEAKTATVNAVTFLREEVKQHQETLDFDNPRDAIDVLLRGMLLRKRNYKKTHIDTDDIALTVFDLFLGGTESITSTLRWAFLHLVSQPDVQADIHAELATEVGLRRAPALSDQSKLHYTGATICESQRIGCVVPLVGPHYVSEDTTMFGLNIPNGAIVVGDFWNMSRDLAIWQDSGDPDKFVPGRFLDESGRLDRRDKQLNVFSRGRRLCPGENVARIQLFLLFSHLLHQFDFSLPRGEPPMRFKGDFKMTFSPKPYKIVATPREW
ncbi:cytochrome P450 2U1-like [Acanthaster planci]|uniref:Cytochrome P450 2U1-like n=1 Tax=Acanthaster planci TaxID=133434 RepID=A0A8B7XP94_ACAPL|nr:cytochrome P450 2U1-like [Acanthaster planci]